MGAIQGVDSSDRQGVRLSVKDPLVCADDVLVTEEKVEVLEGLRQEEGLLNVILVPPNLVDISDPTVSTVCAARILQSLDCFPTPLPILGVLGKSPH